MNLIEQLEKEEIARALGDKSIPEFAPGDTVVMVAPLRRSGVAHGVRVFECCSKCASKISRDNDGDAS